MNDPVLLIGALVLAVLAVYSIVVTERDGDPRRDDYRYASLTPRGSELPDLDSPDKKSRRRSNADGS